MILSKSLSEQYGCDNEQISNTLVLTSTIIEDEITQGISNVFDYKFNGTVKEEICIPNFPKDFEIGLIYGSSGSGKSTILHKAFGDEEQILWGGGSKRLLLISHPIKMHRKSLVLSDLTAFLLG